MTITSLLRGAAATALALAAAIGSAQALDRVTIGTNPAGTGYNVLGGGFAKMIQEKLDVQATARPFSGSSVYLPMLQRGEITMGLNSSNDSFLTYNGLPPYPAAMKNLRMTMGIWHLPYMYWAKKSSGITKIEDLKGKNVVITFRGNASLARLDKAIMATGGLGENDISDVVVSGIPDAIKSVVEGRADSGPIAVGIPAIRQAAATVPGGIIFLQMGQDEAALQKIMPSSWVTTYQPGPNAPGIEGPTRIAMFDTYLNTGVHVPADDIYKITKALYENWDSLRKDYALLRNMSRDMLIPTANVIPYHEGAVKYYKEIGKWTPEHEAQQKKLLSGSM